MRSHKLFGFERWHLIRPQPRYLVSNFYNTLSRFDTTIHTVVTVSTVGLNIFLAGPKLKNESALRAPIQDS